MCLDKVKRIIQLVPPTDSADMQETPTYFKVVSVEPSTGKFTSQFWHSKERSWKLYKWYRARVRKPLGVFYDGDKPKYNRVYPSGFHAYTTPYAALKALQDAYIWQTYNPNLLIVRVHLSGLIVYGVQDGYDVAVGEYMRIVGREKPKINKLKWRHWYKLTLMLPETPNCPAFDKDCTCTTKHS